MNTPSLISKHLAMIEKNIKFVQQKHVDQADFEGQLLLNSILFGIDYLKNNYEENMPMTSPTTETKATDTFMDSKDACQTGTIALYDTPPVKAEDHIDEDNHNDSFFIGNNSNESTEIDLNDFKELEVDQEYLNRHNFQLVPQMTLSLVHHDESSADMGVLHHDDSSEPEEISNHDESPEPEQVSNHEMSLVQSKTDCCAESNKQNDTDKTSMDSILDHLIHVHSKVDLIINQSITNGVYKCESCRKTFKKRHEIDSHILTKHPKMIDSWPIHSSKSRCKRPLDPTEQVEQPTKIPKITEVKSETNQYKCSYCEYENNKKKGVIMHQRKKHKSRSISVQGQ